GIIDGLDGIWSAVDPSELADFENVSAILIEDAVAIKENGRPIQIQSSRFLSERRPRIAKVLSIVTDNQRESRRLQHGFLRTFSAILDQKAICQMSL
ncbi:hypothetical protein ACV2Y0_27580, partial [Enterobacter hormaechei]